MVFGSSNDTHDFIDGLFSLCKLELLDLFHDSFAVALVENLEVAWDSNLLAVLWKEREEVNRLKSMRSKISQSNQGFIKQQLNAQLRNHRITAMHFA